MSSLLEMCISNAIVATALALVVAAVSRLYRRPALNHTLWLLVLLKLITPPIVRIPVVWQTDAAPPEPAPTHRAQEETAPTVQMPLESWERRPAPRTVFPVVPYDEGPLTETTLSQPETDLSRSPDGISAAAVAVPPINWRWPFTLQTAVWIWLIGSGLWFAAALVRIVQFHLLLRHGWPATRELQQTAESIAGQLGLGRCPTLWIVPGRVSPLLWALGAQTRLVLPRDLLESLAPDQQATLLAHELAHARRLDHWVRWVEFIALGLYWWHPVAWLARREIRQAEEQCCDAWVVWALPGRARAYAEALLETVGFLSGVRNAVPPVASGIGHVQLLRRRLTMILRETLSPRVSWRAHLGALLLGVGVLPLAPYHARAVGTEPASDDSALTQTDRETRDLERRLDSLESKLERVIRALETDPEARQPEKPVAPARKKSQADESAPAKAEPGKGKAARKAATPPKSDPARRAEEAAEAARDRAARQAKEHRADAEDGDKVDPQEFAAIARQIAESVRESFDPEQLAELGRQIGEAVSEGVDPEEMAQIGRDIGEAVRNSVDPKQMEELGRRIEQAVSEHFNPERIKELEEQIEQAISQAFDPERMEEMARVIEEVVAKSLEDVDPDQMPDNLDPERLAELAREIGEAIGNGIDAEQLAELGREIGEAVSQAFDPKQMEEFARQIEHAINENFSPERMQELEEQIEEAVSRAFDPERMEELGRAIEEAVNKSLDSEQLKELEKKVERAVKAVEVEIEKDTPKAKAAAKAEKAKPEPRKALERRAAPQREDSPRPDSASRDTQRLERRMKTLEDKMDRLLDALESKATPVKGSR